MFNLKVGDIIRDNKFGDCEVIKVSHIGDLAKGPKEGVNIWYGEQELIRLKNDGEIDIIYVGN